MPHTGHLSVLEGFNGPFVSADPDTAGNRRTRVANIRVRLANATRIIRFTSFIIIRQDLQDDQDISAFPEERQKYPLQGMILV
jgi:hypothetical protein